MTESERERRKKRAGSKGAKQYLIRAYKGCYCDLCGKKEKNRKHIQFHHLIKVADGGPSTIENGSLLCARCHQWVHKNDGTEIYEALTEIIKENKQKKIDNYLKHF